MIRDCFDWRRFLDIIVFIVEFITIVMIIATIITSVITFIIVIRCHLYFGWGDSSLDLPVVMNFTTWYICVIQSWGKGARTAVKQLDGPTQMAGDGWLSMLKQCKGQVDHHQQQRQRQRH